MCVLFGKREREREYRDKTTKVTFTIHTVSQLTAKSWWSYCRPPIFSLKDSKRERERWTEHET